MCASPLRIATSFHRIAPTSRHNTPSFRRIAPTFRHNTPSFRRIAPTSCHIAPSLHNIAPSLNDIAPSLHDIAPSCHRTILSPNQDLTRFAIQVKGPDGKWTGKPLIYRESNNIHLRVAHPPEICVNLIFKHIHAASSYTICR